MCPPPTRRWWLEWLTWNAGTMSPSRPPLLSPQSDDDQEDAISVDLAVDTYSEEEGDNNESRREWLSHHASQSPTPMAVEVARPVARTAAVPPWRRPIVLWGGTERYGRVRSWVVSGHTRRCVPHPRHCGYATCGGGVVRARASSHVASASQGRALQVSATDGGVNKLFPPHELHYTGSGTLALGSTRAGVWGCAEVGESRFPFLALHPAVPSWVLPDALPGGCAGCAGRGPATPYGQHRRPRQCWRGLLLRRWRSRFPSWETGRVSCEPV